MLQAAKSRAKRDGMPFNLELSDIVIPERCPVLGIWLESKIGSGSHAASPALDKLIPELGYVKGNVHVISTKANLIKQDATPDEIFLVAQWFAQQMTARTHIAAERS